MNAWSLAVFLLPMLVVSCNSVAPATAAPSAEPIDPRLAHAREAEPWRQFDANLAMLHGARTGLRAGVLLPTEPPIDNAIEAAAWAAAKASEHNRLAFMIQQETANDLAHARQAVELAESQAKAARSRYAATLDEMGPAMQQLRQAVQDGNAANNMQELERFVEQLPVAYRRMLIDVARAEE